MLHLRNLYNSHLVIVAVLLTVSCLRTPSTVAGTVKMQFVRIPAGSFYMGSPSSERGRNDYEGPVHDVRITKPFYMGKYEVTQAQWKAVMGTTLSQQQEKARSFWLLKGEGPEHPMYYVSWEEAVEFCKKLGREFRLPTEAEWEYACRAGSQTRFHYGDDPNNLELNQYAWYYGKSDNKTHPVGQKKPNVMGLYDMYGNVSELCSDRYVILSDYENAGSVDPAGPALSKSSFRVCRGGNWLEKPNRCRSASRGCFIGGCDLIGFRVVYTDQAREGKEVLEIALPETTASITDASEKESVSRPQIIAGVVRDEAGLPIDDVKMRVVPSRSGFLVPYAEGGFEIYRRPSDPNSRMQGCHFLARHEQRNLAVCMKVEEDANVFDIKLEPGAILTGKVVNDDGDAIEGATVGISLQGSDWHAVIPPLGMETDSEGKFTFRALPMRCKYNCHVKHKHYRRSTLEFDTGEAPDNRVDLGSIVLVSGPFSVSGIVVDANDQPVPNVWIYCTGKDQIGINSRTDANGRFKADGIFKGKVHIIAALRLSGRRDNLSGSIDTEAGATNIKIVLSKNKVPLPKGRTCFPANTGVWVNGALVKIAEVAQGQTVPLGQIEKIEEHEGTFECRDIILENGNRISVIDAHCFMLDSGQWIAAQNLKSGQRLKTLDGTVSVVSVTIRSTPLMGKVYNLKIKGSDRYAVGKEGIIVRDY